MQRFDRQQEADTRIAVHVQHAQDKGCKQVFVRTVDTDVLVILIYRAFPRLDRLVSIYRYLAWFGHGKICPIHQCEFQLHVSWT